MSTQSSFDVVPEYPGADDDELIMSLNTHAIRRFLAGTTFRYCCAGAFVMVWNLSVPLILNAALGVAMQGAILIGYFSAVTIQFSLQRLFVFRHIDDFALPVRHQAAIYAAIVAVQYPTYALSSAFLPHALGLSHRIVYVGTVLVVTVITYIVLRSRVFHAAGDPDDVALADVGGEESTRTSAAVG